MVTIFELLVDKHCRVVDNAWLLLRKHLMMPGDCKKYQSCVVKRVVAMGGTIPQWIIDHFKVTMVTITVRHKLITYSEPFRMDY